MAASPPSAAPVPVPHQDANTDKDAAIITAPVVGANNIGVDETELCRRLKTIETNDTEDPNANNVVSTPVAKSTTSYNDDFIVVDLVVSFTHDFYPLISTSTCFFFKLSSAISP